MITSIIVFLFGPDLHDFCMALDFCYLHASPLPVHSSLCIKILLCSDIISIFHQLKISDQDVTICCSSDHLLTDRLSLFLSQKVHSKPLIDTSDPVHKHKSGSGSLGLHYSQNRFIPCHRVASMPFSIVSTHEQLISNSTHPAKLPFLWKVATVVMMATSCITM